MTPRLLVDTHVLLRWLGYGKQLSRAQTTALDNAVRHFEAVGFSGMTLLEIAMLADEGKVKFKSGVNDFFDDLENNPILRLLPLSYEIALEAGPLGVLRDPADRAIVATARVHGLRLLTSDMRIIESNLVPVVD